MPKAVILSERERSRFRRVLIDILDRVEDEALTDAQRIADAWDGCTADYVARCALARIIGHLDAPDTYMVREIAKRIEERGNG
jgi:hypothetical protein